MMSEIPNTIYLQWHGDGTPDDPGPVGYDGVTWSTEPVFEHDVRYTRGGWISVDERLPEEGCNVLVCSPSGEKAIGWLYDDYHWEVVTDYRRTWDVTHWMPLPSLRNEKNEFDRMGEKSAKMYTYLKLIHDNLDIGILDIPLQSIGYLLHYIDTGEKH
jgi:hypothetical protein